MVDVFGTVGPATGRPARLGAAVAAAVVAMASPVTAVEAGAAIPAWLMAHVGEGPNEIAEPILERARALYLGKVNDGVVRNACYFAMDATRPNDPADGENGGRFYVICEADRTFTAIPAGHGAGRDLAGVADFSNGRRCARHFGNGMDSELTTGGVYVTGDARTSFKGYYRTAATGTAAFTRSFIPFIGEGDTANARDREIGGHAAVTLKGVCLRKAPADPHADAAGYVPFGTRVDYSGGRSNGCTSWSASDADAIGALVKNNPTTLYIYPEASDIRAIAKAVAAGRSPARDGLYWNASCLGEIRAPHYWPKDTLEPLIARYKRDHPAPPPRPTPICTSP